VAVTRIDITNATDAELTIELTSDEAEYDTVLFPVPANGSLPLNGRNITVADVIAPGTGKWYLYATR
jgi:hypothetical protein